MANRYINFVLRHRIAVLALVFLATVPAAYTLTHGVLASSMLKLFFGESPEYDRYVELSRSFSDSDLMVVAFEDPSLLTPTGIARLERIVEKVEANDWVERADAISNADRIHGKADELVVEPYGPLLEQADDDLPALQREILGQPLLASLLVNADGTAGAVIIEFGSGEEKPIEQVPALIEGIVAPFVEEGFARDRLHLAGMVPESAEATSQAYHNIQRIFPLTILVLILVTYLLFLQVWPVVITTGIALLSITWSFAAAILYDHQVNLLMATVPAVIMVVAFSDIIHLCSAYLLELRAGLDKDAAIRKSGAEVGTACFYTSVTTFIGFLSIAFIPTPIFRQLGLVLGLGVGVALFLAMTLVPIFLSFLPVPRLGAERARTRPGVLIDRFSMACMRLSLRFPKAVAFGFLVVTIVSVVGITKIEIETNFIERVGEGSPLRKAQAFIDEHFVGSNFLDLYLHIEGDGDFLEPELVAAVQRYQAALEELPHVDRTLSLVDLLDVLHGELAVGVDGQSPDELPDSRALIAQYLLLFEMSGGEGLERLTDDERRTLRVTVRLSTNGLVGTAATGDRAVEMAREIIGARVTVEPTGLTYLFGGWIESVTAGQKRGLTFALITIALMMMVTLRRIGAGLISMIPNLLPLAVLGGYVGLLWDKTDSDTLIVAMIAVGMAVDDTIHFLTRLRLEAERSATNEEALHGTFAFTGRAIVLTTVILCAGFAPFASSTYFTTRILGTLLPMTLVVALLADLLLVPALVKLGIMRLRLGRSPTP